MRTEDLKLITSLNRVSEWWKENIFPQLPPHIVSDIKGGFDVTYSSSDMWVCGKNKVKHNITEYILGKEVKTLFDFL